MDDKNNTNDKKWLFFSLFYRFIYQIVLFYHFKWHLSNHFYRAAINGLSITIPNDKGHSLISAGLNQFVFV